jgi:putative SOS response-associated peptidase YedK
LCNLYSVTKGQLAIREFTGAMHDRTGNLPPLYGIFPDYAAPVVRNQPEGRELMMASVGHALARLCAEGQEIRSRRHQCPQRQIPAS